MKKAVRYIFAIIILLILMIYAFGVYFFSIYFLPQSTVNGKNVSLTKLSDLNTTYSNMWKNYTLTLETKEGKETLKASSFDYTDALKEKDGVKQNPLYWFLAALLPKDYEVPHEVKYDTAKLKEQVDRLPVVQHATVAPVDAQIIYDGTQFLIQKEVEGNLIQRDKLDRAILHHMKEGSDTLNLTEESIYLVPKVYADNESLQEDLRQYNHINSFQLTYDFADRKELLKGPELVGLYKKNDSGEMVPDVEKVRAYVTTLAKKYDTFRSTRDFSITGGGIVRIPGGIYGWSTDIPATTDHLTKALEQTKTETLTPIYRMDAQNRGVNDIGNSYVEIDIARQHMWVYKEGQLVIDTPVVTGNPTLGHGTPTGTGKIWSRERDRYLTGEDYKSYVHYFCPFNWSGGGIHDADWRSSFGGKIYLANGSHGCVNTPPGVMPKVFESTFQGMPVVVYNSATQKIS